MKLCKKCDSEKPLAEFKPDKRLKSGYASICKQCALAYQLKWQLANKAIRRRICRAYYLRNKAAVTKRIVAWKKANKEAMRRADRARYAKNPEKFRAMALDYIRRNPEQARVRVEAYRARKLSVSVEPVDFGHCWKRDGGLCWICEQPVGRSKATMDHVVPLSRGGSHSNANIRPAHKSCNSRKGARLIPDKPYLGTMEAQ